MAWGRGRTSAPPGLLLCQGLFCPGLALASGHQGLSVLAVCEQMSVYSKTMESGKRPRNPGMCRPCCTGAVCLSIHGLVHSGALDWSAVQSTPQVCLPQIRRMFTGFCI
jgi:hypothetical protein